MCVYIFIYMYTYIYIYHVPSKALLAFTARRHGPRMIRPRCGLTESADYRPVQRTLHGRVKRSSKHCKYKTVKARLWPGISSKSP